MNVDLRAERINRGLNINDAADRIGISRATLRRVEGGDQQPHAATAFKVASFYGYKVTDVWPLESAPSAGAAA
jgi:DNA-binding XRE family transcriptional regulator